MLLIKVVVTFPNGSNVEDPRASWLGEGANQVTSRYHRLSLEEDVDEAIEIWIVTHVVHEAPKDYLCLF